MDSKGNIVRDADARSAAEQKALDVTVEQARTQPNPVVAPADPVQAVIRQLTSWWSATGLAEVQSVAPKAVEYGSRDLIEMGRTLARVSRRGEVEDAEAAELGVWFYALGKMARWTAAIERGELPSDDTLWDLGIYVKMAQRIRETGAWPGVNRQ